MFMLNDDVLPVTQSTPKPKLTLEYINSPYSQFNTKPINWGWNRWTDWWISFNLTHRKSLIVSYDIPLPF